VDGRTLVVVAAVVVAGCGGPAADAGPERTLTPVPVPDSPTATAQALPPGVASDGVADVDALVAAHAAALAGRSFTARVRTTYDGLSGSRVLRVEGARRYAYHDATVTTAGNRTEFVDGEHRYSRSTRNGLVFELHPPANHSELYGWMVRSTLRSALPTGNATVFRTRLDGRTHYELRVDRSTHPRFEAFRNYSARATVRADGFVRAVTVSYVRGETNVTRTVAYGSVGSTTVERPAWVEHRWGTDPTPRGVD